jgi:uncharacterized protein (AIM24 family)
MRSAIWERPRLHPTTAEDETYAGITYHLDGSLVPVLTVEITPKAGVYFEHHILFWKNTGVKIGVKPMRGMLKRMIAGMQIFVTEAAGEGQIAFSRDGAGQIFALHMRPGEEVHVREHQFLAATNSIDYTFQRIKGVGNMLFGGSGIFIDEFRPHNSEGILWLHGYGNVFEKVLAPGEQIDVEPGGWLYKDASVKMETKLQSLAGGLLGSMGTNLVMNRFTGPGRIGLQSMAVNLDTGSNRRNESGGLLGALLALFRIFG